MNSKYFAIILLTIVGFSFSITANAGILNPSAIIEADFIDGNGDGDAFVQVSNGLKWLDLGRGGEHPASLPGWRYATITEVESLIDDIGFGTYFFDWSTLIDYSNNFHHITTIIGGQLFQGLEIYHQYYSHTYNDLFPDLYNPLYPTKHYSTHPGSWRLSSVAFAENGDFYEFHLGREGSDGFFPSVSFSKGWYDHPLGPLLPMMVAETPEPQSVFLLIAGLTVIFAFRRASKLARK